MKFKRAGLAASGLAVVVFLSGCTFLAPQATLYHYDASDGFGYNVNSQILIRNALIIAEGPAEGNLVMTVYNETGQAQKLQITVKDQDPVSVELPSVTNVFGIKDRVILKNLGAGPGSLAQVSFSSQTDSTEGPVPILNNDMHEYRDLLPNNESNRQRIEELLEENGLVPSQIQSVPSTTTTVPSQGATPSTFLPTASDLNVTVTLVPGQSFSIPAPGVGESTVTSNPTSSQ